MRLKVVFEKVTTRNLNNCKSIPDEEEYNLHLAAIVEDMNAINGVLSVVLLTEDGEFVVTTATSQKVFEDQLEPFLSRDFCCLRLKSIEALKE